MIPGATGTAKTGQIVVIATHRATSSIRSASGRVTEVLGETARAWK
jgi:hypothetical protein